MEREKKAQLSFSRSAIYRMLSLFYRHPKETADELCSADHQAEWKCAVFLLSEEKEYKEKTGEIRARQGGRHFGDAGVLHRYVEETKWLPTKSGKEDFQFFEEGRLLGEGLEALIRELRMAPLEPWVEDYERLFGHAAHGAAAPYELEYGEEHSHREPQELGDISAFYEAFGLKVRNSIHERVDHVAVECNFLHFLLFKEAYAWLNDTEEKAVICAAASRSFIADHLSLWLPVFSARLEKNAQTSILKALAKFAIAWISFESLLLEIFPGSIDLPIRPLSGPEEISCERCPLPQLAEGQLLERR
ncbi:MAG: molecular chaperone TorD family protein [Deltaproteobacteria bacterium]|nr:molecular chaperone TorD family protein [Deltaproteobacteria bacterium]